MSRDEWERTFNICWGGVYLATRAFLPLLRAADEAHIVNTSSMNGFWASVGPDAPHTAYSAAKFAVKGFTEALIADFRMNAPHIKVSVVMPGHIGTGIRSNSLKVQTGNDSDELDAAQIMQARARLASMGKDASALSDEEIKAMLAERARRFLLDAPTSAAEAATIILDGVKADRWRILVGSDAQLIDRMVREDPEHAYEPSRSSPASPPRRAGIRDAEAPSGFCVFQAEAVAPALDLADRGRREVHGAAQRVGVAVALEETPARHSATAIAISDPPAATPRRLRSVP